MKLNIAMIGYKFMGKAHSFGITNAPLFYPEGIEPVKKVICGRNENLVKQAAEQFGWEEYATSWQEVIAREDIDVVTIGSPMNTHAEIAIAAAKAGKHIFCEKPIAFDTQQAQEMFAAAQSAGIIHMLGHNYRRVPAVALAAKMVQQGAVGKINHVRAVYLQDWCVDPNFPASWRMQKEYSGSGAQGDLGSHIIDMARFITGQEICEVVGMQETFIKKRPKERLTDTLSTGLASMAAETSMSEKVWVDVTVDDCSIFLARFCGGALGTFESTRMATGRKNHSCIEINGSKGSIIYNNDDMNTLEYYSVEDDSQYSGFRKISATEPEHPYNMWPAGHGIGYENTFINEFADFFRAIKNNQQASPNFVDGVNIAKVLDTVEKSISTKTWECII